LSIDSTLSLQLFKNHLILNFVKFMAAIKVKQQIFSHHPFAVVGYRIRDPGWEKTRDPGFLSRIRNADVYSFVSCSNI